MHKDLKRRLHKIEAALAGARLDVDAGSPPPNVFLIFCVSLRRGPPSRISSFRRV